MNTVLITTAISYTNGSPHIGHLYESILGDFIKKSFEKFTDKTAKLLTGTDEHGKKIETTAKSLNMTPIELCDCNSNKFKLLNNNVGVSYDHFIRTTDQTHKLNVISSINKSYQAGDIYLSNYTGYYNIREECFVTESEAMQTKYLDLVTGLPLEKITEESYFFALSKYADHITQLLQNNLIYPSSGLDSRISNLKDLSISRTNQTLEWGIEFPKLLSEQKHIVYVWFDALLNYVTGSKNIFNNNPPNKTIHIIGKDIVWFHSVIYPAILKSCNYEDYQASNILVHGFVLDSNGIKMSKSLGNVVNVDELFAKFPVEAIRFYFIMETIWGEDIKFNEDRIKELYNNRLIKEFGNLFQRVFALVKPLESDINTKLNNFDFIVKKSEFITKIKDYIITYNHQKYKEEFQNLCQTANKELTLSKPWDKTIGQEQKIIILIDQLVYLNFIMELLSPIIPDSIDTLRNYFGWSSNNSIKLNIQVDKIKAFNSI